MRTIPVPTSISAAAQEFLSAGFEMAEGAPSPAIDDLDGWRTLIEASMRAAGVDAELHVFEAMTHGGFFGAPEDDEFAREVARFVRVLLTR